MGKDRKTLFQLFIEGHTCAAVSLYELNTIHKGTSIDGHQYSHIWPHVRHQMTKKCRKISKWFHN